MTSRTRKHLFLLLIAAVLFSSLLLGCVTPPKPFPPGVPTSPPVGCEDLRKRGGEC